MSSSEFAPSRFSTMDADTGYLSCGIQSIHRPFFAILDAQDLALPVGRNTAHAIMHRREYRNGLFRNVNAAKDTRSLRYARAVSQL